MLRPTQPAPDSTAVHGGARAPAGTVTELRARVVSRLAQRVDELTERMVARYAQEIPAYAALDDPAVSEEVHETTRRNVVVLLRTLARGAGIEADVLVHLGELGRRRAMQGFPIEAVLRAYHVGTWVAWSAFVEELEQLVQLELGSGSVVVSQVLAGVSGLLFDVASAVARVITDAFMVTTREAAVGDERRRQGIVDELLDGTSRSTAMLGQLVRQVGISLGKSHAAVTIELRRAGSRVASPSTSSTEASAALAKALGGFDEPGPVLLHTRGPRAIAVYAVDGRSAPAALAKRLEREVGRAVPAGMKLIGVVGLVEEGMGGIAASYAQTCRALEAAVTLDLPPGIYTYAQLLVDMMLIESPEIIRDLCKIVVDPLRGADAGRTDVIVSTLRALLAARYLTVGDAASQVGVHRHTLSARAQRIETLTGLKLARGSDRRVLELGLAAHDLSLVTGESDVE